MDTSAEDTGLARRLARRCGAFHISDVTGLIGKLGLCIVGSPRILCGLEASSRSPCIVLPLDGDANILLASLNLPASSSAEPR